VTPPFQAGDGDSFGFESSQISLGLATEAAISGAKLLVLEHALPLSTEIIYGHPL